ncbi:MAG: T9SS type A sorting domain-containing protein, partial [Bacteroidia bacterium]|nr:T9SS type A sorting domain-containing protein [Bacteroidia bacterium]
NKCGSFIYCDTIRIDSSSLSNQRIVYNNRPALSNQADNALNSDKQVNYVNTRPEIFLANYPNPFGDKTIIDYQIWQSFSNASLIITNTFGQVVYDQKIFKPIDKVSVDGNLFSNGLYYYSIVIDNSVKLTKMMSVMH